MDPWISLRTRPQCIELRLEVPEGPSRGARAGDRLLEIDLHASCGLGLLRNASFQNLRAGGPVGDMDCPM